MEKIKAVTPETPATPEAAGTQEGQVAPSEVKAQVATPAPVDLKGLDEVITEVEKAADKVAKKNVILKQELSKRNKSETGEYLPDSDVALELETVKKELEELKVQKQLDKDTDYDELQKAKARLEEYRAALVAAKTSQKSAGAPNQDKLVPEEDPTRSLHPEELPTLQNYAAQYKLPLKEIVRAKAEADRLNQPLGLYLRRMK